MMRPLPTNIMPVVSHSSYRYIDEILLRRKQQFSYYNEVLSNLNVNRQSISPDTDYNYSYYPILFKTRELREIAIEELNNYNIFPRRYFSPSLDTLHYVDGPECPISRSVSNRILCLPLYHHLNFDDFDYFILFYLRKLVCKNGT